MIRVFTEHNCYISPIWATVKLGDTLVAFFVKPCCSCRTNSTTTFIFSHVTALHTILNGHALLTTMGVQIIVLWMVKCLKSADFDMSGPETHLLIH